MLGNLDVVDTYHFPTVGINYLLVQQVLAHGEPRLIGTVWFQSAFVRGEIDLAGHSRGELIVAGNQGAITAAAKQHAGHPAGLVGGLNEEFLHAAYKISIVIVGVCA